MARQSRQLTVYKRINTSVIEKFSSKGYTEHDEDVKVFLRVSSLRAMHPLSSGKGTAPHGEPFPGCRRCPVF